MQGNAHRHSAAACKTTGLQHSGLMPGTPSQARTMQCSGGAAQSCAHLCSRSSRSGACRAPTFVAVLCASTEHAHAPDATPTSLCAQRRIHVHKLPVADVWREQRLHAIGAPAAVLHWAKGGFPRNPPATTDKSSRNGLREMCSQTAPRPTWRTKAKSTACKLHCGSCSVCPRGGCGTRFAGGPSTCGGPAGGMGSFTAQARPWECDNDAKVCLSGSGRGTFEVLKASATKRAHAAEAKPVWPARLPCSQGTVYDVSRAQVLEMCSVQRAACQASGWHDLVLLAQTLHAPEGLLHQS